MRNIYDQIEVQVCIQVESKVRPEVCEKIFDQIFAQVTMQVRWDIIAQVRHAIASRVIELDNHIRLSLLPEQITEEQPD